MIIFHDDIQKADLKIQALQDLRSFLDPREPELAKILVNTWQNQGKAITYKELREALMEAYEMGGTENVQLFERLVAEWRQDYSMFVMTTLAPRWVEAINEANTRLRRKFPEWTWEGFADGVKEWTDTTAARFVTNSTAEQIGAIREVVRLATQADRYGVDELGRVIRPMVGLTQPQARANWNYYNNLIENGVKEKKAVELAERYAAKQHRYRGQMIARTELAFSYNHGAYMGVKAAQEANYMGQCIKRWITARDERTCFPKNTKISTPNGKRDIQDIKPGDYVNTPNGAMRVHKTIKYEYDGDFTLVISGEKSVMATKNHPFKTQNGWKEAGSLTTDDFVYFTGNESGKVDAVFNFSFSNSDNSPTVLCDFLITSRIFFGSDRMPIVPVSFNDNSVIGNAEVNAISTDLDFGLKTDIKSSKSFSNHNFDRSTSGRSSIAMKRTIPSTGNIGGNNPKIFPASFALNNSGRSSAFFRTEMPIQMRFCTKNFTAPFTGNVFSIGKSAFTGADCEPIGNGSTDFKGFSTDGAYFGDHSGAFVGKITLIGAEFSSFVSGIEHFTTIGTSNFIFDLASFVVTFSGTETTSAFNSLRTSEILSAVVALISKHSNHLNDIISQMCHKRNTTVYNLEVCTNHVYYADDFLVHNCHICAPLDGKEVAMDDEFAFTSRLNYPGIKLTPPLHPHCRCGVLFIETAPPIFTPTTY